MVKYTCMRGAGQPVARQVRETPSPWVTLDSPRTSEMVGGAEEREQQISLTSMQCFKMFGRMQM